MEKICVILGGLLLVANIAILSFFTNSSLLVILLTSYSILLTTILIFVCCSSIAEGGFKVSLPFMFCFLGLVEYILSCFMGPDISNYISIALILLLLFQIIILVIIKNISSHD